MIFDISHLTRYRYSRRINLNSHLLRLKPRCDANQQILKRSLSITPSPLASVDYTDAWGNAVGSVEFSGQTDLLEINLHIQVQTGTNISKQVDADAENFRLTPDYGHETKALAPYLEIIQAGEVFEGFILEFKNRGDGLLLPTLDLLNQRIARFHQPGIRLQGAAQLPEETLKKQAGVCRDLAWLFIAACRQLGLAARFVSGYQKQSAGLARSERYLHAWAEVYLPGIGWRGYDQTHGQPVADEHVVVACGASQSDTMPVEGSFAYEGQAPQTSLDTQVFINVVEAN